jgi:hypothetical protein
MVPPTLEFLQKSLDLWQQKIRLKIRRSADKGSLCRGQILKCNCYSQSTSTNVF